MDVSFDIDRLAAMLRAKRGTKGLREVAQEIGAVSASTLSRVEQGKLPDLATFTALCDWLSASPEEFMGRRRSQDMGKGDAPTTSEVIAAHLRADRTLDPKTAEALSTMIRLAYESAMPSQGKSSKGD